MALIDDVKEEIKKAHTPKVPEQTEEKPEKKRRQKTKEEIAAYIARKRAEEEERMLANHGNQSPKKQRRKRRKTTKGPTDAPIPQNQDIPEKKWRKPRQKKCESSCTKYRPRHVQTIDLPDGGSLVVIYMAGNQS